MSETVYRHQFKAICYTSQVRTDADIKGWFWLIDLIASHVAHGPEFKKRCKDSDRFRDMSIWILSPNGKGGAIVKAVEDTEKKYLDMAPIQEVEFTDFDFSDGDFKLYLCYTVIGNKPEWVLMYPDEY